MTITLPLARWCGLLLLILASAIPIRADWRDQLSPSDPGSFPPLRPVKLEYEGGWGAVTGGEVKANFSRNGAGECELQGVARTTGIVRALWRLDATHDAVGAVGTLRPETVKQQEVYRGKTITTELSFDDGGVDQVRNSTDEQKPGRKKRFDFPGLYDLQTALLYVRSQKLAPGDVYRLVVYPATAPYLATVTVLGRERITVKAGTFPAIKLDLKLEKVMKDMTLAPHGKFKRATAWLSEDADRLPLRLNAQIFVGSVWVELEKVD